MTTTIDTNTKDEDGEFLVDGTDVDGLICFCKAMRMPPKSAFYSLLCAAWMLANHNKYTPEEVMEVYQSFEKITKQ
jgi:hypothetical protein